MVINDPFSSHGITAVLRRFEDDARAAGLRLETVSATPPPSAPESTPTEGAGDPVQGDPAPLIATLEGAVAKREEARRARLLAEARADRAWREADLWRRIEDQQAFIAGELGGAA